MLFNDESSCVDVLESLGYIVIPPINVKLKTPKDLAKYFYRQVYSRYNISIDEFNWKLESMYAKTFLIQLSPVSKASDAHAMLVAIKIIDSVIKNIKSYEKYFNIDTLQLFIMDNTAWIVRKALYDIDSNNVYDTGFTREEWESVTSDYDKYLESDTNTDLINKLME